MRILHVNEVLGFVGGAEQYLYAVANELKERGHTNLLIYHAIEGRQPETFAKVFHHCEPFTGVSSSLGNLRPWKPILPGSPLSKFSFLPERGGEEIKVESWAKDYQPDVVYVHRWETLESLELLYPSAPMVRFIHDHGLVCLRTHKFFYWTERACQQPMGVRCVGCLPYSKKAWRAGVLHWPMALSRQKAELQAHGRCTRLLVSTTYMKEQLLKNGIPDQQVTVLPLFTEYRSKFHARPERDTILVVGRIDRGKGLDLLLGALKLVKHPFRLTVVGEGKDLNRCRVLAHRLGLQQKVEFVGRMDRSELSEWYRRALMVAVPCRAPESFGLVALEAMAHGRPVVAFRVGGLTDVIRHGETGFLVEEQDQVAFANQIDCLLRDPDLALEMGRRGVESVKSHYSPDRHLAGLVTIFRQAAEGIQVQPLRGIG